MKTIASLAKTTAVGGLVFLLPLVLLVVVIGKAFNIIRTISTPVANLISAEKFAGFAVADLLGLIALLVLTLLAGMLARSPVFERFYKKSVGYFTNDRVGALETDFAGIASSLKTLGSGSSKIIPDTARLRRNVQS